MIALLLRRSLPLLLSVCTASGLADYSRPEDQSMWDAAAADGPAVVTRQQHPTWMERPATKSALLVLAGGLAGAMAKSATAPLERVKIMSQAGEASHFVKLLSDVVRVEGWWGLWRGNSANVIRVIPNKGVLMMCSDMYKAGVSASLPGCNAATISSVAGGLAGLTAVLCTYPLELVRTRMAYQLCDGRRCTSYNSVVSTLRSAVATGGPLGLYIDDYGTSDP